MVILDKSTKSKNFSLPNSNPGNNKKITRGIKISNKITNINKI
jgi:hypothetical protein